MILILIFFFGCVILLICFGLIKHYYLRDKYEQLISKKFNSMGYKVLSIRTVEKPNFIAERNFVGANVLNPLPVIITYRFVELENIQSEKKFASVSIERMLYSKPTLAYYLDDEGSGVFNLIAKENK